MKSPNPDGREDWHDAMFRPSQPSVGRAVLLGIAAFLVGLVIVLSVRVAI